MEQSRTVDGLFQETPWQWGLRGDPHLWDAMLHHFVGVPCPHTPEGLASLIETAFEELTGHPISHPGLFYVQAFDHGGMSAGHVSPEFWREKAVPFLQQRLDAGVEGQPPAADETDGPKA